MGVENKISRSTAEAYSAILITIATVMFPLTWWLCFLLAIVAAVLAADVMIRSELYPILQGDKRPYINAFVVLSVLCLGALRSAQIYNYNDKFTSVPEIDSFDLIGINDGLHIPVVRIKNVGAQPLYNYELVFGSARTDHILTLNDEVSMMASARAQIKTISKSYDAREIRSILQQNDTVSYQNPNGVLSKEMFDQYQSGRYFQYLFIFIEYRKSPTSQANFARFCVRLTPKQNSYIRCLHPDLLQNKEP